MLEDLWPHAVNEEVLTRCVSVVRKLLDDVREPPRYIETVWGEGYRFIGSATFRRKGDSAKVVRPVPWPGSVQPAPKGRAFGKWALAGALLAALAAGWLWRSGARTTDPGAERMAVLPMTAELADDQWLDRAVEAHDDRLVYLAVDAHFRDLHGDPDFRSLAQRVGLADILPLP